MKATPAMVAAARDLLAADEAELRELWRHHDAAMDKADGYHRLILDLQRHRDDLRRVIAAGEAEA